MTGQQTVLAVDLGAESGRVMAVHTDGERFALEELHRFTNPVTELRGTLYWDVLHLWREIQHGIAQGKRYHPLSIGVDTWAVDFALLDANGDLLGNPVMYRDPRTDGMMEIAFSHAPKRDIFAQTGIQFMQINTLYQLLSMVERQSPFLNAAQTFLTIPDLLNYWLTGTIACEFTNATTTQMLNPTTGDWARDMLEQLGIPHEMLPRIVQPGTTLGEYDGIPVIAPATHDTGSAVAGIPMTSDDAAYISSGTWSLVGVVVDHPVIDDATFAANVTNEGGVGATFRLLKNVMGLWVLQQCRATWAADGIAYGYDKLVQMAEAATSPEVILNIDDDRFLSPGDHPQRIRDWYAEQGASPPESNGAIVRAVLEGLAQRYADVVQTVADLSGKSIEAVHVVSGGSQNALLNQFTADACGVPVVAGPVEATVLGNAAVQFMALGVVDDLAQARRMIAAMGDSQTFTPASTSDTSKRSKQTNT